MTQVQDFVDFMRTAAHSDRADSGSRLEGSPLCSIPRGAQDLNHATTRPSRPPNRLEAPSVDCRDCAARRDGLCSESTPDMLRTTAGYKWGNRRIPAGKDLFSLGDSCDYIYNLVDGWMFLYGLLEDGRRQILQFVLPGAVLGFHPAQGSMATYGVQALTDAVVCVIPRKALEPLSRQHPEIAMRLAQLLTRDCSLAFDHLTSIGRSSARERVAHLLLELYIRYHAQWPGSQLERMYLPVTQEHIGDAVGLTFVHTNRVLRELKEEGIVEFHYRRLRILDPDRLIDVAGIDPHLAMAWLRRQQ